MRLLLVGGGHAHVQVIRSLSQPLSLHHELTLLVPETTTWYSGMVPGAIARFYAYSACQIDLVQLCQRHGWRLILGELIAVHYATRTVEYKPTGGGDVAIQQQPFDLLSLNVGSQISQPCDISPAAVDRCIFTRPISRLCSRIDAALELMSGRSTVAVAVVGSGAAGIELAFALHHRLRSETAAVPHVTLVDQQPRLLAHEPSHAAAATTIEAAAAAAGICIRSGARVAAITSADNRKLKVELANGDAFEADFAIIASGAAPTQCLASSPDLPKDSKGFICVNKTLQVRGLERVFAVGDCGSLESPPPKAGVYAVRQGPVLTENLRRILTQRAGPLLTYEPQQQFLALIGLGDGTAVGAKYGMALHNRFMWWLKQYIDKSWIANFQT